MDQINSAAAGTMPAFFALPPEGETEAAGQPPAELFAALFNQSAVSPPEKALTQARDTALGNPASAPASIFPASERGTDSAPGAIFVPKEVDAHGWQARDIPAARGQRGEPSAGLPALTAIPSPPVATLPGKAPVSETVSVDPGVKQHWISGESGASILAALPGHPHAAEVRAQAQKDGPPGRGHAATASSVATESIPSHASVAMPSESMSPNREAPWPPRSLEGRGPPGIGPAVNVSAVSSARTHLSLEAHESSPERRSSITRGGSVEHQATSVGRPIVTLLPFVQQEVSALQGTAFDPKPDAMIRPKGSENSAAITVRSRGQGTTGPGVSGAVTGTAPVAMGAAGNLSDVARELQPVAPTHGRSGAEAATTSPPEPRRITSTPPSAMQAAVPMSIAEQGSAAASDFPDPLLPDGDSAPAEANQRHSLRTEASAHQPLHQPWRTDVASLTRQLAAAVPINLKDRPVEIALEPVELGRVRMTLATHDGAVSLVIAAERPETLDLMRRHADLLTDAFGQVDFAGLSLAFGDWSQGGHPAQDRPETLAHEAPPTESPVFPTQPPVMLRLSEGASERLDLRL